MLLDKIFGNKEKVKEHKDKEVDKIKMAVDSKKILSTNNTPITSLQANNVRVDENVPNINNTKVINQDASQNFTRTTISGPVNKQNMAFINNNINNSNSLTQNIPNNTIQNSQIDIQNNEKEFDINKIANSLKEMNNSIKQSVSETLQGPTKSNNQSINQNDLLDNVTVLNEKNEEAKEELKINNLNKGAQKIEDNEEDNALYIRLDKYEEIIKTIDAIKSRIRENEEIIAKIIEIKKEEDIKLNKWEAELRDVNEKVNYIDEILRKH